MDDCRILLTGDYLHRDFQNLIRQNHNSITLVPVRHVIEHSLVAEDFSMIVIAQSRRNQFESELLETILSKFAHLPVIALSGSWCEGEARSGNPVPGLIRIYWHQWQGRLNNFRWQLANRRIATWNLPRTYSLADQALNDSQRPRIVCDGEVVVGISGLTPDSHAMLHDVCQSASLPDIWIDTISDDEPIEVMPKIILVDGNSMNRHFINRLQKLKLRFSNATYVALLNFPRQFDIDAARREGVEHVVSKPFCLNDLHLLLNDCLAQNRVA